MKKVFSTLLVVILLSFTVFYSSAIADVASEGTIDSFTPFEFFSNQEAVSISGGNLLMRPFSISLPGRSGMNLSLTMTVNTGEQRFIFDKYYKYYLGETSRGLDKIVYENTQIDLGPLGVAKAETVDHEYFPVGTLSYDPGSRGWDVSWSENKGVVILSSVSPHKEFSEENEMYRRQIIVIKSGGGLERYDYRTGHALGRRLGSRFITDLSGDAAGIAAQNEVILYDESGREYRFIRSVSGVFRYRAHRSWRCGTIFNPHTCNAADLYDGWQLDAFLLKEVRDPYGNIISVNVTAPDGQEQVISDNLGRSLRRVRQANSEEWIVPGIDGVTRIWHFDFNEEDNLVRAIDPLGQATTFNYNYMQVSQEISAFRSQGLEHLENPGEFIQVQYPTGGIVRYEMFTSDREYDPETWFNFTRQIIVTEIPDFGNQQHFYQKYYILMGRKDFIDSTVYESDGTEIKYHFDRAEGQTLLKTKTIRAGGMAVTETYDWRISEDGEYVDGILNVRVSRDGKEYDSLKVTYDEAGRVISVKDAAGQPSDYIYLLGADAVLPLLNPEENLSIATVQQTLNRGGLLSSVSRVVGNQVQGRHYYYGGVDQCGKALKDAEVREVTKVVDGFEKPFRKYCYDDYGNVVKVTLPSG